MISSCRIGDQWRTALAQLANLKEETLNANSFIMNAAMASCIKCQQWKQAAILFASTLSSGIQPDCITYNTALSSCSETLWQRGSVLLRDMRRAALQQDLFSYNTALKSGEKAVPWQHAQSLFQLARQTAILPDTISANSLLSSCASGSRWERAVRTLLGMPSRLLQSDIISHSSALTAFPGRQWSVGCMLLHQLHQLEIQLNVLTYNTAISMLSDAHVPEASHSSGIPGWPYAVEAFAEMWQVQRDIITYNASITAAKAASCWELAVLLFQQASGAGLQPNTRTQNAVVAALDGDDLWRTGVSILRGMRSEHLRADVVTYASVQSTSAQSLQWLLATYLLLERPGLQASVVGYGTAVSSCAAEGRWGRASRIASVMLTRALLPNAVICNSLLNACDRGSEWVRAVGWFDDMFVMSVSPDLASQGWTCETVPFISPKRWLQIHFCS